MILAEMLHWSIWLGIFIGILTVVVAILYTLWKLNKEGA